MKDSKGHGSNGRGTKRGGPHKVQSLDTNRVGQPWATAKSYGNKTVAERVANFMRTDGGYMRVRTHGK